MDGSAMFFFLVSLTLLITTAVLILYSWSMTPMASPGSGTAPLPDSTMIGAQCPMGCTCFPNTVATVPSDTPTQVCAMLDNDTMFKCPARCCQPTCI